MSLLEPLLALGGEVPAPVGLGMVALMGVSMGITACAASCLPFIGVWALGRDGGGRKTLADLGGFLLGRLAGYALLGLLAGAAGDWLVARFDASVGHTAIGLAGLTAGAALIWGPRAPQRCGAQAGAAAPFLLGLALSLTPCAPLSTLLAAAAMAGDPALGAGYGLAFGLGAAVTPLVVILPLIRALGARIQSRAAALALGLRYGAGGALALIGLRRLLLAAAL